MSEGEVDYESVDWTEQEEEMEALEVIFPEELVIKQQKPYKFEIKIKANVDYEELQDKLVILLLVELPHDYPVNPPFLRLKNLTKDNLDNRTLDQFEDAARKQA